MKKLFKEQSVSLYQIQKDLNLELKRLYRYADGTCKISSMPTQLILDLSVYFKIHPENLYNKMIEYEREKISNENIK